MKHIVASAALILATVPALAQPDVSSPDVHPDGSVTFRLVAPKAREVQLHCEGLHDSNMAKDTGTNGVWTLTTRPLEPDIYTYTFDVDGVQMIDPRNSFI